MYRSRMCDVCRAQQSRLVPQLARTPTTGLTAPRTIATQARALHNSSPRVSPSLPSRPFTSSSSLRYKTVEEAKSKYRLGVCPLPPRHLIQEIPLTSTSPFPAFLLASRSPLPIRRRRSNAILPARKDADVTGACSRALERRRATISRRGIRLNRPFRTAVHSRGS